MPGINTTARCANPPNLMFPLLRRSELCSGFAVALFYLMIFNNISKDSFEIFKTNLKTGGGGGGGVCSSFPLIITIFSNRNVEITPFVHYFPHKNFFCNTNNTFRFCHIFALCVFFNKNICN